MSKNNSKVNALPDEIDAWAQRLPNGTYCYTDESNIKFEEKKGKIVFENKSRKQCIKINVDGGVISASEKILRCDNMLVDKSCIAFYFVELKGKNIPHAIEQLYASLKNSKLNPSLSISQKRIAIAVGKNDSPLSSPFFQGKMKEFKRLNADLWIRPTPAKEQL